MIIGDINGNLLTIEDSEYQQSMVDNTLDTVLVTASYNKGESISKTIVLPQTVTWFCYNIPLSSLVAVKQIYVKNLLTGQRIGLLQEPHYNHDESSLEVMKQKVEFALNEMGISGFTQNAVISDVYDIFAYTVTGLPTTVCMDTFEYEFSGVPVIRYFSQAQDSGLIISTDMIYINPAFFNLETFVEGVYQISITLGLKQEVTYQASGCYFLDRTMKCRLSLTSDFECGLNTSQMQFLMLHYSLTQASNCKCDCEKMHTVYEFLNKQLPLNSKTQDCGCY